MSHRNRAVFQCLHKIEMLCLSCIMMLMMSCIGHASRDKVEVSQVIVSLTAQNFNPLNEDRSLTVDHAVREAGIPVMDKDGIVRFQYFGTYWGDRPTIEQTLEMIREEEFDFEHPI